MAIHRRSSSKADDLSVVPRFTRSGMVEVPRNRLPERAMLPQTAYQIVMDEVMLDGNARFNLATFVTTWMDDEADRLYAATFDKNMIDKDEYPQTAEIESRCVRMLGDLWHAPHAAESVGTSTTGSSEGCMLAGLALKRRWQQARRAAGHARGPAEHRHGRQRAGGVGEVRQLLGGRAALRAARGRRLPPDRRPAAGPRRREHDRRRGDPRLDDGRQLRAGAGDLRGARRVRGRAAGSRCRCTSTPPPAASSRRSCSPTWSGTSGWSGWCRSRRPGTSSGWSTPASAGCCGATPSTCPRTSSSTSTTWAATCRRSR